MEPIATATLDLAYSDDKMGVRLYAPEPVDGWSHWGCRFEIDEPLAAQETVFGASSLQALVLALKTLSAFLYGSEAYQSKQLGIDGRFGGDLSIPAQHFFLDIAPYPF